MKNKSFIKSEHFKTTLFLLVLAVCIAFCFMMALPFIKAIGWALALTIVAYPIHSFIGKKVKTKSFCAFLSCLAIILLILIPAIFLVKWATQETIELSKNAHSVMNGDNIQKYISQPSTKFTKIAADFAGRYVNLSELQLENKIKVSIHEIIRHITSIVGQKSWLIAKNVVASVFWIFIVFIMTFFLLRDGDRILEYIRTFIPLADKHKDLVFRKVDESIKATIYGWIVIGLAQGFLLGLMFWILHLNSPVLWGAVTFFISFVPLIGAPGVWVPASIILLIKGMYVKGIILFLCGLFGISLIDNVLRPILVGNKIHLHIMLTFFAIFGGLLLMGPLGLIMGPVIFAVTISLLDVFKHQLEDEEEEEK